MTGLALALAAGAALVTASAPAQTINVNMYASNGGLAGVQQDPATLEGPAGGLGETWNQFNTTSGSNLLDSTGAATTVGFTNNVGSGWGWGNPDLGVLKAGRAHFGKGDDTTHTITGLSPGESYNLWVASYAHNTTPGERALGEWSTPNPTVTSGPQLIDSRATGLNGTTWELGVNYVLFENVEADGNGEIVLHGDACDAGDYGSTEATRLALSGFQITPGGTRQPLEMTDFVYDPASDRLTLTWKSNPGEFYGLYWSEDLADFEPGVAPAVPAHATGNQTSYGPFANPRPGANRLFARVGPPDLEDPKLDRLWGNNTTVSLEFSEPMHPTPASDPLNFTVRAEDVLWPITSAELSPDGLTVTLTLGSPLPIGTTYTVTISNLTDLAHRPLGDPTTATFATWDDSPNGIKVFILAGQSNMVGHGKSEKGVGDADGAIGSLRYLAVNDASYPEANYSNLLVDPGQPATSAWKTRRDVQVWWKDGYVDQSRVLRKGDLGIGYAGAGVWFGPEYAFGQVIGDHFSDPVLIIKTAWGGIDLDVGFRPPSAVAARGGTVGPYYTAIIDDAREVLGNLETHFPAAQFPDWNALGYRYQIAGFGWHQGYNDVIDAGRAARYEDNLVDLISDLRAEFGRPDLPISIGTTSMFPPANPDNPVELAQRAVADPAHPEFAGTVFTADTGPFWRDSSVSPSNFGYHWNHNGETHYLIGDAMGRGMVDLLTP